MRPLSSGEINRIISHTQSGSFSDTCTIDVKSVTRDSYGAETATYTAGSQISCGFELLGGSEAPVQELVVTQTRGVFRLPITSAISIEDRITLKKRYNQSVNYVFEVVSEPVKNLDCIRAECVLVGY